MKQDRSGAEVNIPMEHHRVHNGQMFGISVSGTISSPNTIALHITTPATKRTHFFFRVSSDKGGTCIFAEGDTLTGGTGKTPYNKDRLSPNTYGGTVLQDATRSAAGTTLDTLVVGSSGVIAAGGSSRKDTEVILNPSTSYTILFTAAVATVTVSIDAEFYEV